jgi:hypothetical protein
VPSASRSGCQVLHSHTAEARQSAVAQRFATQDLIPGRLLRNVETCSANLTTALRLPPTPIRSGRMGVGWSEAGPKLPFGVSGGTVVIPWRAPSPPREQPVTTCQPSASRGRCG